MFLKNTIPIVLYLLLKSKRIKVSATAGSETDETDAWQSLSLLNKLKNS